MIIRSFILHTMKDPQFRLVFESNKIKVWHILYKGKKQVVDRKTKEVLAELIDFNTHLINPFVSPNSKIGDFKMWMKINSCERTGQRVNEKKFNAFEAVIENQGSDGY